MNLHWSLLAKINGKTNVPGYSVREFQNSKWSIKEMLSRYPMIYELPSQPKSMKSVQNININEGVKWLPSLCNTTVSEDKSCDTQFGN